MPLGQPGGVSLYGGRSMKAVWNGAVVAQSDDIVMVEIVMVENNTYFPADAVHQSYFRPSTHTSVCPWKGTASYYTLEVDGQTN